MSRILYDLAGADPALRFSPYCWRTRLALAHKGLAFETRPWRFTDKEAIAFSGQDKVPVLRDGERVVHDSWAIATYLEEAYPDRPRLFAGSPAATRFTANWADAVLNPAIGRLIVSDIPGILDEKDHDYFRTSREARYGMALEAVTEGREARVGAFRDLLLPLRLTLRSQHFLGGGAPDYGDYCVFGGFMWARCVSDFPLLVSGDLVFDWHERMLDACGSLGRDAVRAR
jgi:glutathione S-transferase